MHALRIDFSILKKKTRVFLQPHTSILPFVLTNKKKLCRYIYGNRSNEHMTVEELNGLERYLEIWMYNIRSAKVIHENSQIYLKKYHFIHC
jgi:hypothetical protein